MTDRDYGTEEAMREQLRDARAYATSLMMQLDIARTDAARWAERCDDLRKYIIMRKVTPECWEALEDD